MKKLQTGRIPSSEPSTPITPASSGEGVSLSFPLSGSPHSEGNCYGCSSATLEHCITILKALAFKQETRKLLVDEVGAVCNVGMINEMGVVCNMGMV